MNAVAIQPNPLKVELRKVKYSASLSEETSAFTAEVWFDGVRVGTASNHGTGGPNNVHLTNPQDYDRLKAFIATQPPESSEWGPIKMTVDFYFGNLIDDFLKAKDAAKHEKRFEKMAAKARLSGRVILVVTFKGNFVEATCLPTEVEAMTLKINQKYGKGATGTVRIIR